MPEDFVMGLIVNVPNFAGFIILAYVLQRQVERQQETIDRLTEVLIALRKRNGIEFDKMAQ